jgi:hypothetical protein
MTLLNDDEFLELFNTAHGPPDRGWPCARCGSVEWPENPRGLLYDGCVDENGALVGICCITDAEVEANEARARAHCEAVALRRTYASSGLAFTRKVSASLRVIFGGRTAAQRRTNKRRLIQRLRRNKATNA